MNPLNDKGTRLVLMHNNRIGSVSGLSKEDASTRNPGS